MSDTMTGARRGGSDASPRSQHGLDALNFFAANVETAFGPFVSLFLTREGWGAGAIGTVITLNSVTALATQVPAGWLVDHVRGKRLVVLCCLALVAAGALLIAFFPVFSWSRLGRCCTG